MKTKPVGRPRVKLKDFKKNRCVRVSNGDMKIIKKVYKSLQSMIDLEILKFR